MSSGNERRLKARGMSSVDPDGLRLGAHLQFSPNGATVRKRSRWSKKEPVDPLFKRGREMRFHLISGLIVVAAGIGGCASGQPEIQVGTVFRDSIRVESKIIPLPPGKWIVTHSGNRFWQLSSTGGPGGDFSILRLTRPGKNPYNVLISTNKDSPSNGWSTSERCQRNDMLFRQTTVNVDGGDQECWYISDTGSAVFVGYRLADSQDFLNVWYYFGIDDFAIDRVKTWGSEWLPRVKAGFRGNLPSSER